MRSKISQKQWMMTTLWVIMMTAWTFLVVIAAQFAVGYITMLLIGREGLSSPIATAVCTIISDILAIMVLIFVAKRVQTRDELGLAGMPTWTDIGLSPIAFVVSLLFGAALAWIFGAIFPWFQATEVQQIGGLTPYMPQLDKYVSAIAIVILVPIAEEIIFRGWFYGKMRERLSIPIAVLITSLLFAMVHDQWNVKVNVFALSVVLCILRELTGTIYAGILTHMIKNGIAFYMVYVIGTI